MKEAGDTTEETINACLQASSGISGGLLSKMRIGLQSSSPENILFQALNGFGENENHNNNQEDENDQRNNPRTVATLHDFLYEPTQQSISIRTRRLLAMGDADAALELIESGMEGRTKLRAYRQVFSLFLGNGDIPKAISLFEEMKLAHKDVPLEGDTFVQLLATLAEKGYFSSDGSKRLKNTESYSHPGGPDLFEEIVSDMALYVDSLSSASAMRLRKAFVRACHGHDEKSEELHNTSLVPLAPTFEPAEANTLIADRVTIDPSTGLCIRIHGVRHFSNDGKKPTSSSLLRALLSEEKEKVPKRKVQRKKPKKKKQDGRSTALDLLRSLEKATKAPALANSNSSVGQQPTNNHKEQPRHPSSTSAIDSFFHSRGRPSDPHRESWRNAQQRQQRNSVRNQAADNGRWQETFLGTNTQGKGRSKDHPVPAIGNSSSHSQKSIFDVFSLPQDSSIQRSPTAFDAEAYDTFEALLEIYLQERDNQHNKNNDDSTSHNHQLSHDQKNEVLRWIRLDEPQVKVDVPVLTTLCEDGRLPGDGEELEKKHLLQELEKRSSAFQKQLNWNSRQYNYALGILQELAVLSHTRYKVRAIAILWEKMKEAGDTTEETINACLQASSGISGGLLSKMRIGLQSSSPENILFQALNGFGENENHNNNQEDENDTSATIPEQLATLHDFLYEPTQQSISIRTRRLLAMGDADAALELIESGMEGRTKLRAYRQVFSLFLGNGDIPKAISLFEEMKLAHKDVPLEGDTFVQLLATLAEKGYFSSDGSKRLKNTESYSHPGGPDLFEEIVSDMALYVDSLSSASAMRLRKAFVRACHGHDEKSEELHNTSLVPLAPTFEPAEANTLIADRVTIDPSTGLCIRSGARLRQIVLNKSQKTQLKDSLLKRMGSKRAIEAMSSFCDWLSTREGRPFTVIVDAANICYFMQNFDGGKFNFHQIRFVVKALEEIGESPLVVMPAKYLRKQFRINLGTSSRFQKVSPEERAFLDDLENAGTLYAVPEGCLDDYFWIVASVSDQENSTPENLETAGVEVSRRWSGARPVIVTNDQSRDHRDQEIQLLEPMLFNRWYSTSIVNYSFTGFVDDVCVDPEIVFNPTDAFSREIQCNVSMDGRKCCHFPVHDWEGSDWFCLRIPSSVVP
ncbi:expressed unknown protein [Seminavis robusta]|uniref:Uncharacterized protein n=1 Tax=Seminavis robusta TaxID=568900 RepID=A0A9N8DVS6_9STRA|nr:expressed unknown protein [Seminavis robusta]|eukprot:Sro381_g130750.1 n/a (1141) ;mRNA; f:6995-11578